MYTHNLHFVKIVALFCTLSVQAAHALMYDTRLDGIKSAEYLNRFAYKAIEPEVVKEIILNWKTEAEPIIPERDITDGGGYYHYTIQYPRYYRPKLLFITAYADWVVSQKVTSCRALSNYADTIIDLTDSVPYQTEYQSEQIVYYENTAQTSSNDEVWTSTGSGFFQYTDSRDSSAVWGVAYLVNCDLQERYTAVDCSTNNACQGPVVAKVEMHMQNGHSLTSELSMDEKPVFGLCILFIFLQVVNIFGAIHTKIELLEMKKYHITVRMLVWSIALEFISLAFNMFFWAGYIDSGTSHYTFRTVAHYCESLSIYLLTIMLICLAKGWTIVRPAISPNGCLKLVAFGTFYALAIIFAETYSYAYYDYSRSSQYFYHSASGVLCLILRSGFAPTWFGYATYTTMKQFNKKRAFYRKFLVVFMLWFTAPLLFMLIAMAVSPLGRVVYNFIWETSLVWLAQYSLLIMYNPQANSYNKSYPFHQNDLPYMTNIPWKTNPRIKDVRSRKSMLPRKHLLTGTDSNENINVLEIYQSIRDTANGMLGSIDKLIPKISDFKDVLEDWDVEDDEEDHGHRS